MGILICIIVSILALLIFRKAEQKKIFTPINIIRAAERAANQSQCDHVVTFDGIIYQVHKSKNQYAARGDVVYVAHPEVIND